MGDGRHRRLDAREDDPTTTALRRLQEAGVRPAPGWVPRSPSSPATGDDVVPAGDLLPGDELEGLAERLPREEAGGSSSRRPAARVVRTWQWSVDRLPTGLRAAAVAPVARAVAGLALLVGLAVVAALVATWLSRPHEEPLPDRRTSVEAPAEAPVGASVGPPVGAPLEAAVGATTGRAPGSGGLTSAGPAPSTGTVWVHVAGAVREPGVVELAAGSRVADAVTAAGGPTRSAQTASVNLARLVVDGEQVVVFRRGSAGAVAGPLVPGAVDSGGTASAPTVPGAPAAPVDLNTASMDQLDTLPGIGPVLAQRILEWRSRNGRFSVVDELGEVSGIGEATLADLRPVVTV